MYNSSPKNVYNTHKIEQPHSPDTGQIRIRNYSDDAEADNEAVKNNGHATILILELVKMNLSYYHNTHGLISVYVLLFYWIHEQMPMFS